MSFKHPKLSIDIEQEYLKQHKIMFLGNRQSLPQSVGNGRVHNKGFGNNRNSYPMYLESNNNNSNAMPKLISHARDRRSYMETNNLPVHSGYYDDGTEATYIASELAGGKIPMCCKCHIKIVRYVYIFACI